MSFRAILVATAVILNGVHAFTGDATYYFPNGQTGACGAPSQNSDLVVALSSDHYTGGANCWRHIGVRYEGKSVDATVVDLCLGCVSKKISLSSDAFQQLANLTVGRVQVTWDFVKGSDILAALE